MEGETYLASLRGDKLEWLAPAPKISKPLEVSITISKVQLNAHKLRGVDRDRTYKAILHSDRVEWLSGKPETNEQMEVRVNTPIKRWKSETERKAALGAALEALAESGAFSDIEDPVAWQREIRKDRPLPGRD